MTQHELADACEKATGPSYALEHYSTSPLGLLYDTESNATLNDSELLYGKPRGLWLSVKGEDDWPSWCNSEGFRLGALTRCSAFDLAHDHRVLIVGTSLALMQFDEKYGFEFGYSLNPEYSKWVIDWRRVAHDYDGIIIAPYQWAHRLDGRASSWYYGWDCASGCIWRPSAALRAGRQG